MDKAIDAVKQLQTVRDLLEKSRTQIQMALPKHMTAERMMRIAMTSIQRTPKLLECHPVTLIGAIIQSAQLGLEPDGITGMAYLVPYYNSKKSRLEVQLIPGYKGLVSLARRSGEIGPVEARIVRARDDFDYAFGLTPLLKHSPSTHPEPGVPVYAYAIARLKDEAFKDSPQFDVMSVQEINKIRDRSKAKDSGPWVTDWDEMAKKTVLRRLCKLLPLSVELQSAVALDERASVNLPQDLGTLVNLNEIGTSIDNQPAVEPVQIPQEKKPDDKPS